MSFIRQSWLAITTKIKLICLTFTIKIGQMWSNFTNNLSWSSFIKIIIKLGSIIIFIVTIATFLYDMENNIDNDRTQKMDNLTKYIFQYRQNQDLLEFYSARAAVYKTDLERTNEITRKAENNYLISLIDTNLDDSNPYARKVKDKVESQDHYLRKVSQDSQLGAIVREYVTIEDLKKTVNDYRSYEEKEIGEWSLYNKLKKEFQN